MIGDDAKPAWMRWGGAALALVVAVLLVLWLREVLTSGKPSKPMKLQQITLMRPPPPPPKPPEEKPPEPEVKEEVKLDQPTPEPQPADAPPPGADLGVDAEGSSDGDGFGLVGKKGAGDLIGSGGGTNPWGRYDALLNEAVSGAFQQALARDKTLKGKNYKVMVKVWIDSSGKVTRSALVDSTGDARADEVLKEALNNMRALRDVPPAEMPQPVKIRVTSRA
ncbi:MAG: energy transducer TonB [Thiobacillus sp.]|nr:energy transducer TonB [Thiobacillus sp.]